MRARKVITRSGRKYRGKFPSRKLNRSVHWESWLERDTILQLEYHPHVLSYQEQPSLEHWYDSRGEVRDYYPDFLADLNSGTQLLIEVKPEAKLRLPEVREKLAGVALRFCEQGRAFRILTEADVRRQPLHDNLLRMHDACRLPGRKLQLDDALHSLAGIDGTCFSELVQRLGHEWRVFLLYQAGHLQIDLEAPITDESPVRFIQEGGGHGAIRL